MNVGVLLSGAGELVTKDMEMAKITQCLLQLSPYWSDWPSGVRFLIPVRRSEAKKSGLIREHLNKLDRCKSKRPDNASTSAKGVD